ncbi:heme-binding domain-containing protein [Rapidithrix thailandica]|uniref:Heme-binding domain-containing protein n=1 Tax=Rapidithrix thailandica TaxID=413964 RepID=A0AAW9S6K7_9BACT
MNKKGTTILAIVAILAVMMQFFPIDKTNPVLDPSKDITAIHPVPNDIKLLLQGSCYDCHSNQTAYPWYTSVAPVSWWIKHHINEGREHLNFSTWADYSTERKEHKLEECVEELKEGEMPLESYTWMHGNAKLSPEDRQKLVDWFSNLQ